MSLARAPATLAELHEAGLYRRRRVCDGVGHERVVDGRRCVVFCDNGYLGLAEHPAVADAFVAAAKRYGVGSGGSHLVSGHTPEHHALEEELAAFVGRPRALLFSSGYLANLGIVAALARRGETVVEDRLNHASLLDAAAVAGAKLVRYRHADAGAADERLGATGARLLVTDGVFSMDGDLAPLAGLAAVAARRNTTLVVDDAHGFGVLGDGGRGSLERLELGANEVPVLMATLGKALGSFGAFVAGDEALIETLIQRARSYIYTTAPPAAVAAATRAALRLLSSEAWRRSRVAELVDRFRSGAQQLGLALAPSETPIQPVVLGDARAAVEASEELLQAGFLVTAIRPPTVPAGTARLRVTLSAAHTEEQVDALLDALGRAVPAR